MSQKVGSHGLQVSRIRGRETAKGLEVLLGRPALGESGKRDVDDLHGSHLVYIPASVFLKEVFFL